jgi:uncharacterized protein YfaS (alpha-2-macroglobulin family)
MSQPLHTPRRDWKDAVILVLGAVVLLLGAVVARGKLGSLTSPGSGLPVGVFDVVLDRENLGFIEIQFDQPLGAGKEGAILGQAPATIDPGIGGVWKWKDSHVLRFEASNRLAVATEYTISLLPERLLASGQPWRGDRVLRVKTDQFKVERVELFEEPVPDRKGYVTLRGQVRFNYAVNPEQLAGKIKLFDPEASEPSDLELEADWQTEEIGVRTVPLLKGKDERTVKISIDGALTSVRGNLPLGETYEKEVVLGSSVKLTVRSVEAIAGEKSSTLRVMLSSTADPDRSSRFVSVDPAVELRLTSERNSLDLVGPFVPGETYTVKLAKGLPSQDDASLQDDYEVDIEVPDLEPSLDFQSAGRFLSKSGFHAVALQSVNQAQADLTIDRVYRNNLFALFQFQSWEVNRDEYYNDTISHALGDRLADETLELRQVPNKTVVTAIDLDKWVARETPGLYRIGLTKAGEYSGTQRWLLLTDLGIVAKRGLTPDGGELNVWVSSFANLQSVAGAHIRVVSDQNQTLAEGNTDANGAWSTKGLPAAGEGGPYLLIVDKGDDFSFLLFDQSRVDLTGFDVGGATLSAGGYNAFLYGERNLYRPGETAVGVAVVRDRRLAPPPTMPLILRHRDPQGRERGDQKVTADSKGAIEWSLALPNYTPTGHHTLELLAGDEIVGTYHFQVEDFVPDRIKVEITSPADEKGVHLGDAMKWTVASQYLFGPPAAGLPVETRVRLVESPFVPAGFDTYTFDNPDRSFEPRELANLTDSLDDEGRKEFSVTLPEHLAVPSGIEAQITARVQEQGGRGVAAMKRLRFHPYPYYLGLRKVGEDFGEPGKPTALDWVAVTPEGKATKGVNLRAELFRDEWNTVLRRGSDGTWNYESTRRPILVDTQTPASAEKGTVSFTPREYGAYRLVLSDLVSGASTAVTFYVSGWGYSPWALESPARVELTLDRNEYQPGDTAKLLVKAPFAGKLIVTIEREHVFWSTVQTLTGNTGEIQVPVTADLRPNAYVSVLLVRGSADLGPGMVGRAFGTVPINVDRTANQLPVKLTAPAEMRPEGPLTVEIDSAPGAVVTLSAVDEGILQLIAQKTPDPFSYFYAKLALSVDAYDLFSQLMPEVNPKAPAGGGEDLEGSAQFLRTEGIRRVEPVAFWSGVLTADANGKARATFQVPEFQGALRLMAVANRGAQFGAADSMLRVRTPLVLLPTFPRFLSYGDTLKVPVGVRNDTGQKGTFDVTMAAEGAVTVGKPAQQQVTVDNGRQETLFFTVDSTEKGTAAHFTVTASGAGETSKSTAQLPVGPDLPARTVEQNGSFAEAKSSLANDTVAGFRADGLRRDLRIGPLPVLALAGKLESLLRYPYGCVEQTTSKAFPLVYLADLAKQLSPDALHGQEPAALIQEALRRLATMQVDDGGFSMWPGGDTSVAWGSLYASHFLVEARRAGHPVAGYLYDQALDWVSRQPNAGEETSGSELQRTAYALYILARAGKADLGSMDFVRDRLSDKLPGDARALLAGAYAAVGNSKAVGELIKGVKELETIERQTGDNLDSTIRRRAVLLLALLDAAPSDARIPTLADRLMRDTEIDGWWTTQETSFALLAIGQLAQRQGKMAPYSGKVYAGDKLVASFDNKPVTITTTGTAPVRVEMNAGYQANAAFYSYRLRGIPTDAAFKPESAGLEVQRKVFDREGREADLATVPQGALMIVKTSVRSVVGDLENVVVENLLPSGLEVENPRLEGSEAMPWLECKLDAQSMDIRDDRVLAFTSLTNNEWIDLCVLVRAVSPGTFRLPPVQAEAMYNPAIHVTGARGSITVVQP